MLRFIMLHFKQPNKYKNSYFIDIAVNRTFEIW
jgi:hypothetical protein